MSSTYTLRMGKRKSPPERLVLKREWWSLRTFSCIVDSAHHTEQSRSICFCDFVVTYWRLEFRSWIIYTSPGFALWTSWATTNTRVIKIIENVVVIVQCFFCDRHVSSHLCWRVMDIATDRNVNYMQICAAYHRSNVIATLSSLRHVRAEHTENSTMISCPIRRMRVHRESNAQRYFVFIDLSAVCARELRIGNWHDRSKLRQLSDHFSNRSLLFVCFFFHFRCRKVRFESETIEIHRDSARSIRIVFSSENWRHTSCSTQTFECEWKARDIVTAENALSTWWARWSSRCRWFISFAASRNRH